MSAPAQNPPLLLTKRLTSFLHANQTPQLPTLLLTTPSGKLLAHASAQPVSALRTQATVAASLLAIHTSSSVALPSALPGARTPDPIGGSGSPVPGDVDDTDNEDEESDAREDDGDRDDADGFFYGSDGGEDRRLTDRRAPAGRHEPLKPSTITVQLTGGTVLIRRLKCGLLFVCVGPSPSEQHHHQAAASTGTSSSPHQLDRHQHHDSQQQHPENGEAPALAAPAVSTSPSEIESLVSAGGQTTTSLESAAAAAVVSMRRHASELARWLDDKLSTLAVPDEGVGVE